jgi:hypothetical protein
MWSRVVEIMLGHWLLMSPFIFGHEPAATWLWAIDLGCGAAVIAFGLLSYWEPTRGSHFGTLAVAVALIAAAFLQQPVPVPPSTPIPPEIQNQLILGLLLMMFALVPNEASQPGRAWRELRE